MTDTPATGDARVGARLGHYELLEPLGAGGMGEVFRARDLQLDRDVALKLLPAGSGADRGRLRRFGEEARAAAQLSHPNILVVYELAEVDGNVFIASELLEGETLRQRLAHGALPWRKAVEYGVQICGGLAAAHEHGIVHCDLKPENLFVTSEDRVKILDFGLARLSGDALTRPAPSRTMTLHSDAAIRGTLGYLAPEQIRHGPADQRADLFAFGAILYEMLSGRRAFAATNPAEMLGAILQSDPLPLPLNVPAPLSRIVQRCVEKEPAARFRSAHDLALALESLGASGDGQSWSHLPSVLFTRRRYRRFGAAAAVALAISLAYVAGSRTGDKALRGQPVSFSYSLAGNRRIVEFTAAPMAVTADGREIILALTDDQGSRLWRRRMDSEQLIPIDGTDHASSPFLSPDGQWIAFAAGGKLKRVSVEGGAAQVVADAQQFFGGCWLNDETIVFAPRFARGLWRVAAAGGTPVQLTVPEASGSGADIWPACLPDGRSILYTHYRHGEHIDESAVAYITIDGARHGTLVEGAYHPRYLHPDRLLFARLGTLVAVPFDPSRLELRGRAQTIAHGLLVNINSQVAFYETSNSPHLVFVQGRYEQPPRRLVWVDRGGNVEAASAHHKPFSSPRVAPDGRHAVTWLQDDEVAIWRLDFATDQLLRLSRGTDDHNPVWSPDGTQVAFDSSRSGNYQLYIAPVDTLGGERQLTQRMADHFVNAWLPDGRLAYTEYSIERGGDLWLTGAQPGAEPQPLLQSPFSESEPMLSPDGRWIAYVSDETHRNEVYVQRFPPGGSRVQASRDGGEEPLWSRSGDELYYRNGNQVLAVRVAGDGDPQVSPPEALFSGPFHYNLYPTITYDVGTDGRFLMVEDTPPPPRIIHVTLFLGGTLAPR